MLRDLIGEAGGPDDDPARAEAKIQLREVLHAVAGKSHGGREVIDPAALGRYLTKNESRVIGVLCFTREANAGGKPAYRLHQSTTGLDELLEKESTP
jgi:hypothetical protein